MASAELKRRSPRCSRRWETALSLSRYTQKSYPMSSFLKNAGSPLRRISVCTPRRANSPQSLLGWLSSCSFCV